MAGELARGLVDGDACPVCGSCEHPRPAEQSAPVTAEDIEAAEAAAAAAMSARGALQTRLASARATEEARAAELSTLLGDREPSRVGADLAQARERLQQAEDASSALPSLTARLIGCAPSATRSAGPSTSSARPSPRPSHGPRRPAPKRRGPPRPSPTAWASTPPSARAVAAWRPPPPGPASRLMLPAQPSWATTARSWRLTVRRPARCAPSPTRRPRWPPRAVGRHDADPARHGAGRGGFTDAAAARAAMLPTAELGRMAAHLRSLDTQRDQAEALLAQPDVAAAEQQPAPDLDALAAAAVAAREAATQSRRAQALAESADRRIHELRDEVLAIVARIGPAEAEQAVVQELADCVGGTSGNNTLRMRLSSYLLAARLEEVARLANERLQVMTEGRYSLVYSDALARRGRPQRPGPAGRRRLDRRQPRDLHRCPAASPSWPRSRWRSASPMPCAPRPAAFDLQTLFVDEGFGTLDDDSLEQVMGVLDGLREGGRSVGIVSHVSELRQRIPAQLRVTKSQAGSTIDVVPAVAEVA